MHYRRTTGLSKLAKITAMMSVLLSLSSQAQAQSALDGFDPNANAPSGFGSVRVVVFQPDGKILMGGDFLTLSPNGGATAARNHIARLNPNGTLDTTFDPNANGSVYSIALQRDGKILVAGGFTSIGGQPRNHIARLDATTGLVDSFAPNVNDTVWSVAVQGDGKILVGGYFHGANSVGGETRNHIARLDATTGLPDSFDPSANNNVLSIVVQANGKILAGGGFTNIGGTTRHGIARLDPMSGAADAWNPNASDSEVVRSIALQADGKILVGGLFGNIGGQPRNRIARLDPMTGAADSFDPMRSTATRDIAAPSLLSQCSRTAKFWRPAFSRTLADKRAKTSLDLIRLRGWPIRSSQTRAIRSMQSRCSRTARS